MEPRPQSGLSPRKDCVVAAASAGLAGRIPKLEPRKRPPPPSNPTPVPSAPALPPPPDTSSWSYIQPTRRILSPAHHQRFLSSPTEGLIRAWVFSLADAVLDTPCSAIARHDLSANVKTILDMLHQADELVAQSPPQEQQGSRFGNKAFRGFLDLVERNADSWHRKLGLRDDDAIAELSAYWNQSFGNGSRIDYGSGHELNFIVWLLCLYQLRLLTPADFKPIVLCIFSRYLSLMRTVQMTYYLEPAGSHGVWGLDDYQFLPFLFGASQLLHHPYITPRSIHQDLVLEQFGQDFLYLGQVSFVNSTKTVKGLRWHSPMLDDISAAKSWAKIDGGMRRMFVAEVLGKLPVMQHFLFGSLIPAVDGMSDDASDAIEDDRLDGDGAHHGGHHSHPTGWGDCCGIKVPSSIAAAQEAKRSGKGDLLRPIPFD